MRVDDITGQTDVPISGANSRMVKTNNWNADFYLSIHHNSGVKGGSGGGLISFMQNGANADTQDWRKRIYDSMIAAGALKGNRSTPMEQKDLAVTRETNMSAILVECAFMDSSTDVPILLTDAYALICAKGLRNAIVAKWGLTKKSLRYGDINGDGSVDSSDARIAARYEAGLESLTVDQKARADVNGDGEIDTTDTRLILQREVGLITKFPVELE